MSADDIVPVERLTRMTDRFRCGPLRCVLSAQACIRRQGDAREDAQFKTCRGRSMSRQKAINGRHAERVQPCADCETGRTVAASIRTAALAAAATRTDACPRCGDPPRAVIASTHPEVAGLCGVCRRRVEGDVRRHGLSHADAVILLFTQTGAKAFQRGRELAVLGVATSTNGLDAQESAA